MQTVKVRRAWNGGLERIDDLLYWLYENDVLNKTDKGKKDSIFRQYYRYYNDGDTPRGVLRKYGVSSYDKKKVEEYLEIYLNEFISTILKKYCGKYDKSAFRSWRKNKMIESIARRVEIGYGMESDTELENMWLIKDESIISSINDIRERRKALFEKLVKNDPSLERNSLSTIMRYGEIQDEEVLDEYAIIESRQKRLSEKIRNLKEGE